MSHLLSRLIPLLARVLARLPLPLVHALGSGVGLAALASPRIRRTLAGNLRQAGLARPGMTIAAAREFGKNVLETLAIWQRPTAANLAWVRAVNGWPEVEAAAAAGRGVLVLIPHLGNWELIGQFVSARMPFAALYRPPRQDWADRLMRQGRERNGTRLATPDLKGVRVLLKALRNGEAVAILPDQVASKGEGAWVPFFGRPAYMPTLAHRLARGTGAAAFLFFCERLAGGRGYRLRIETVDAELATPDSASALTALNARIEELIHAAPAQYLWNYPIYRRAPPSTESSPAAGNGGRPASQP